MVKRLGCRGGVARHVSPVNILYQVRAFEEGYSGNLSVINDTQGKKQKSRGRERKK